MLQVRYFVLGSEKLIQFFAMTGILCVVEFRPADFNLLFSVSLLCFYKLCHASHTSHFISRAEVLGWIIETGEEGAASDLD